MYGIERTNLLLCLNYARALNTASIKASAWTTAALTRIMNEYSEKKDRTYEDAVRALNSLQTNAATLAKIRQERGTRTQRNSMPEMAVWLQRVGIERDSLDKLNVIHVSGSKGKGSVCAFSESILRCCGFKTGFYSSPHLIEVRERFRINGIPISKDLFPKYFFHVWDGLVNTKEDYDGSMPPYFRFLTLLGFHIFLEEQVDCTVLEVGIGGLYDCTNIVRHPVVCGIASVGLEHQRVLGDTIQKIARHKAGIMKTGSPAVTVPQFPVAAQVIKDYAAEVKVDVSVAPPLQDYSSPGCDLVLGLDGKHQEQNASLALQLCKLWLRRMGKDAWHDSDFVSKHPTSNGVASSGLSSAVNGTEGSVLPVAEAFAPPSSFLSGLRNTRWPGRNQIVQLKGATLFVDGAHTPESVTACVDWFLARQAKCTLSRDKIYRVLVFNVSGGRDPDLLLSPLVGIDFDAAIFCASAIHETATKNSDTSNFTVTKQMELDWCEANRTAWVQLHNRNSIAWTHSQNNGQNIQNNGNEPIGNKYPTSSQLRTEVFSTISQALDWLPRRTMGCDDAVVARHPGLQDAEEVQLLVTGSIHLVGGVLKYLDVDPMNTE